MTPCVLHLDIDAFFASVEELRNPTLRGKPVAVGAGVIASASYEARRCGLCAGMPLRKALQLCPDLRILDGHAAIYRAFSEHIFLLCGEYAPEVETYLDEAYCDWNGTERLYPDPVRIAAEIQHRVVSEVGLTVTLGIGRNRMLAKMASKSVKPVIPPSFPPKGTGIPPSLPPKGTDEIYGGGIRRVLQAEEDAFIRNLPVRHLPGVGPKTEKLLSKLNIHTIEEMRVLSRESLRRMLGLPGLILYERCRGQDTQPISRREIPCSIRRETSFHAETTDRDAIEGTIYYLTERAANTLRKLRLKACQLGVKIRYSDYVEESAIRKLPAPTQLDSELFLFAIAILRSLYTRRVALRLVGVHLGGFIPDSSIEQLELFQLERGAPLQVGIEERRRERRLLESLDAIRQRYGYAAVVCGKSLHLLGKLPQDDHGFILRTPSLTR